MYDCDEVPVTANQARAVALIANQLATNVARGRVRLCIRDDGPGCDPAALQGEGMQLVRDLVRSDCLARLYPNPSEENATDV